MKRIVSFIFLLALLGVFFIPLQTDAVGPFGGAILQMETCNTGWNLLLSTPTAGYYMYIPGTSIFFLTGPPSHVGQWLLGMSGPPTPCYDGPVVIGYGNTIIFTGTSI